MGKRVLHVVSGDLWGGAEAQMGMQIPELHNLGFQVAVLCFSEGVVSTRYRQLGIEVLISEESSGMITWLRGASELAAKFQPDIIIGHGYKEIFLSWYLSLKLCVPWFAWFHGITEGYTGFAGVKDCLMQLMQKLLARFSATRIISVSKDSLSRLGFSSLGKSRVIYNVSISTPTDVATEVTLSSPALVVVGRLTEIKRVDRAIDAFSYAIKQGEFDSVPNLYIIGEGPLEEELRIRAKNSLASEQIHFLGFRPNADEYISQSDLLIISSDSEGVPTVLLEALLVNCPIVATAVGGIPEVVQHFPNYPASLVSKEVSDMGQAIISSINQQPQCQIDTEWENIFEQLFSPEIAARNLEREINTVC